MNSVQLILNSLNIIREQEPKSYLHLCTAVNETCIRFVLNGRQINIGFSRTGHRQVAKNHQAEFVEVQCNDATLEELVAGSTTIHESIKNGSLFVKGNVAALNRLQQAMSHWLHGIVHSSKCNSLFRDWEPEEQEQEE